MKNQDILNKEFEKLNIPASVLGGSTLNTAIMNEMHAMNATKETETTTNALPALSEREEIFMKVSAQVKNEIDHTKHGSVAASIILFCKLMNGASFKECNMFWKGIPPYKYNSTRDRGGSMSRWLTELQHIKKRKYSNSINYIKKAANDNKNGHGYLYYAL